jgi:CMP-N,N'-diacetyllegionaminic acid synthase
MRILGVIPARGGSRAVPRKNIRLLGGRPLIAHTISAAGASDSITYLVVSTDDAEIATIAGDLGVDVVARPSVLAGDEAPMVPVIQHALDEVERDRPPFDAVFTLQATCPFRTASDIDAAAALLAEGGADSVIGVVRVQDMHPARIKRIEGGFLEDFCVEEDEGTRRQDLEAAYRRSGGVYLTARETVVGGSLRGLRQRAYEMPPERSINIDEPLDFLLAEAALSAGMVQAP